MNPLLQNDSGDSGHWLRNSLAGFQPEVPADSWERLLPQLPGSHDRQPVSALWRKGLLIMVLLSALFHRHTVLRAPGDSQFRPAKSLPAAASIRPEFAKTIDGSISVTAAADGMHNLAISAARDTIVALQAVAVINPLPLRMLCLFSRNPEQVMVNRVSDVLAGSASTQKNETGRTALRIEGGPVWSFRHTNGYPAHGLNFVETPENPAFGWQGGISMAVATRKAWQLWTGFQVFYQQQSASHTAALRLLDGVCLNPADPGVKKYAFRYGLLSGGERSELRLTLEQEHPAATMPKDEPFMLAMKTKRRSLTAQVPVVVERSFHYGKNNLFVQAGATVGFSLKTAFEVEHYSEACQDLCFSSGHTPKIEVSSSPGASLGFRMSAGVAREILPGLSMQTAPYVIRQKSSWHYGLTLGFTFKQYQRS